MGEVKPANQMAATAEQAIHDLLWLSANRAGAGVAAVIAERRRQVELSYDLAHDRSHPPGWLSQRGAVQAAVGSYMAENDPDPDAARVLCAEGGALAAAEIDRLAPLVQPVKEAG